MVEKNRNWMRDLLIVPLIVGLTVALIQYTFPIIFEKEFELTYSIEEPKLQIDKNTIGDVKVEINDIETSTLYSQSIKFWNSGEIPIKSLPIKYVSENSNPTYKLFFVSHTTKPKYEFGNITMVEITPLSQKYIYDLLNPNDEFTITFLTNEEATQNVYLKVEGLNVKKIEQPQDRTKTIIYFAVFIALFTEIVTVMIISKKEIALVLMRILSR